MYSKYVLLYTHMHILSKYLVVLVIRTDNYATCTCTLNSFCRRNLHAWLCTAMLWRAWRSAQQPSWTSMSSLMHPWKLPWSRSVKPIHVRTYTVVVVYAVIRSRVFIIHVVSSHVLHHMHGVQKCDVYKQIVATSRSTHSKVFEVAASKRYRVTCHYFNRLKEFIWMYISRL